MVPSNLSKPVPRNTWTTLLTTEIPTVPNMPEPKKLISKVLKTSVKIPWNSNMVALVLLLQNHIVKALIMLVFLYFLVATKMLTQKWQVTKMTVFDKCIQVNNALIWDEDLQDWRQTSMADKFCKRPTAAEEKQFNVGCKVPDHDGPLAEGWEANSQWKENADRAMPGVADGEVSSDDFGQWTDFVNCMKGKYTTSGFILLLPVDQNSVKSQPPTNI